MLIVPRILVEVPTPLREVDERETVDTMVCRLGVMTPEFDL